MSPSKKDGDYAIAQERTSESSSHTRLNEASSSEGKTEKTSPPTSVYERKLKLLNEAMQNIGFGKYHRRLFIVSGFGWFVDSSLPLLAALILAPIISEFKIKGPYLILALRLGFFFGACFWGPISDIKGRRWPFTLTLLIASVFTLASGGSLTFPVLATLIALAGFGVGGNIPVDSAVFLEFMPSTHRYLLTVLAIFWSLGQIFVDLLAWSLMPKYSCQLGASACPSAQNMGWRYVLIISGGVSFVFWVGRFFMFHLYESPRYLLGRGQDAQAVDVVQAIAKFNGVPCSLTLEDLKASETMGVNEPSGKSGSDGLKYILQRLQDLFSPRKAAVSTTLLVFIWSTIHLATVLYISFLPYLLVSRGSEFGDASLAVAYRNQLIITCSGLLAPLIAGLMIEMPIVGRRRGLAAFSFLTGAFLLASTTSRTSNVLLAWNCGFSFAHNAMYAVLGNFTAEVFPTRSRGTGNALVSLFSRLAGVVGPLMALYLNIITATPIYIAGGLTLLAGVLVLLVPYESRRMDLQ
ncbi:MFS general substrate transporter [Coprinopsis marcescibilis]|uniref:MFS general substrate transporter n=1 Tax=Coprinopsis marcescibilis TaxID=230819 RepID=A0A5C3L2G3_COPMA|nr:MFS general substrate transporter [Coprinopsis marcescibilis]